MTEEWKEETTKTGKGDVKSHASKEEKTQALVLSWVRSKKVLQKCSLCRIVKICSALILVYHV